MTLNSAGGWVIGIGTTLVDDLDGLERYGLREIVAVEGRCAVLGMCVWLGRFSLLFITDEFSPVSTAELRFETKLSMETSGYDVEFGWWVDADVVVVVVVVDFPMIKSRIFSRDTRNSLHITHRGACAWCRNVQELQSHDCMIHAQNRIYFITFMLLARHWSISWWYHGEVFVL